MASVFVWGLWYYYKITLMYNQFIHCISKYRPTSSWNRSSNWYDLKLGACTINPPSICCACVCASACMRVHAAWCSGFRVLESQSWGWGYNAKFLAQALLLRLSWANHFYIPIVLAYLAKKIIGTLAFRWGGKKDKNISPIGDAKNLVRSRLDFGCQHFELQWYYQWILASS